MARDRCGIEKKARPASQLGGATWRCPRRHGKPWLGTTRKPARLAGPSTGRHSPLGRVINAPTPRRHVCLYIWLLLRGHLIVNLELTNDRVGDCSTGIPYRTLARVSPTPASMFSHFSNGTKVCVTVGRVRNIPRVAFCVRPQSQGRVLSFTSRPV